MEGGAVAQVYRQMGIKVFGGSTTTGMASRLGKER